MSYRNWSVVRRRLALFRMGCGGVLGADRMSEAKKGTTTTRKVACRDGGEGIKRRTDGRRGDHWRRDGGLA
jgi:hypothetical protein